MKNNLDYFFLTLLAASLLNTAYQAWANNYIFNLENYLAVAGLIIVTILRVALPQKGRVALVILLLLGLLNIGNFFLGRTSMHVGVGDVFNDTGFMTINPVMVLVLIAYYLVNMRTVNKKIGNLVYGSKEDQAADFQKKYDFYLKNLAHCLLPN